MPPPALPAEVNIHLRARAQDRDLIDQAAALIGANRSQFMLSTALREAQSVLLDQTTLRLDAARFQKVMERLDAPPSAAEAEGLARLKRRKARWARD
jgi:uncharacterized protein (DUF1778 family)